MWLTGESNWTRKCNGSDDCTGIELPRRPSYWALALLIIPTLTLFGNLLVIISVVTRRSLRSPINYFIMGLAIADMCVATAVMPFAVYVEFNEHWELGTILCDLYCAADVTCSTASIFLLTVISFDRYVAATQPIRYANSAKGIGRVAIINLAVWAVSMLIASPMVLGLNNVPDRDLSKCMFYNADFLIYSSTGSFCIPLVIIMYLYARIYCVIRQRGKFAKQRQELISAASRCSVVAGADSVEKPLLLARPHLPSVTEFPNDDPEKKAITDNGLKRVCKTNSDPKTTVDRKQSQNSTGPDRAAMTLLLPPVESAKHGRTATDMKNECGPAGRPRCHSTSSTRSLKKISEVSESPNEVKPDFSPVISANIWPRRLSLPHRHQYTRNWRHWSLARSKNVTKEAPLTVDVSAFQSLSKRPSLGTRPSTSLSQDSKEDENNTRKVSSRLSSGQCRTRLSSVVIDSSSTVTIVYPSTIDGSPSPNFQRRSTKSSLSSMWKRSDGRKRMSEGSSPLLRQEGRAGCRAYGKGSLDDTAREAKARWLRRLSTRLILWRSQRDGSASDIGVDGTVIDRDGIKQPLLLQAERRFRMPRKSTSKQRKEKKATKTLAIVLGIFLICWLPFFTLNLLNAVCMKLNNEMCQVGFLPFFLTTWLGYTNSMMNPVIYTIFNADFRRAFKEILCSRVLSRRAGRKS